jgi:hypothetical protein
MLGGAAQAAAPKTDAAKIANAMTAAPPAVSRNASVVEMNEDGSMKELHKGTNGWTCVPDDPSTPGNDPMCLDPNAMEWLHAYLVKSPPPDQDRVHLHAAGWLGFQQSRPLCDEARRRQGHYHRTACHGRRARS